MQLLFTLTPFDMEFRGIVRIKHKAIKMLASFPLLLLLLPSLSRAQELELKRGVDPLSHYEFEQIDSVGLMNGSLNVDIPLISYPQRGKLRFGLFASWNSKNWLMVYTPAGPTNVNGNWAYDSAIPPGVTIVRDQALRFLNDDSRVLSAVDRNNQTQYKTLYTVRVGTPDGGAHPVGEDASGYSNFPSIQGDGSGIVGIPNGDPNHSSGILGAYDRDWVKHIFRSYSGGIATDMVDPNGNTITTSLSGWTDTLGRVIPGSFSGPGAVAMVPGTNRTTVQSDLFPGIEASDSRCTAGTTASRVLNLPGPPDSTGQATTSSFAFCYANYSYQTAFHAEQITVFWQGIRETSGTAQMLRQIVLPDGSSWLFDYDSYLDLTQITFPTGGYVRYVWVNFSFDTNSQVAPIGRTLAQRISNANDGTGEHIRKYHYVSTYSDGVHTVAAGFKAISVDEAGNEQVDFFDSVPFAGNQSSETDTYQGGCGCYNDSSSLGQINGASSTPGTLLHSVKRSNFLASNYKLLASSSGLPQTIQTVLASGKTSAASIAYDSESIPLYDLGDGNFVANNDVPPIYNYPFSLGQQTSISQSDYGAQAGTAGPVLRTITRKYFWSDLSVDPNGNYKASNLIDLLESEVIADGGGVKVTETDYKYDETTPQASSVTTQHGAPAGPVRGNLTTISQWLNTSSNPVVRHINSYDTGEIYQSIDALGNTTTHSYDSYYAGAYSTKTCNALTQCISGTYDFSTGLLTSISDANASYAASGNTAGDPAHTNYYGYDNMLRMTLTQSPPDASGNRPQINYYYPNPNTVEVQKKVTPNLIDDSFSYFDGLARPYKSVHATAGNATQLTTYDVLGRVASVTNPFVSTSDPTYGVVQTQYDALGRVTKVTKQDGSIALAQYDQSAAVLGNADCTIAIDETGATRKTCNDSLRRLVQVEEPPTPNAAASPTIGATANLPITGSLLSAVNGTPVPVGAGTTLVLRAPQTWDYIDVNGHVHELWCCYNGGWSSPDITGLLGAPSAETSSPLSASTDSSGNVNIFYINSSQHLELLAYTSSNGSWTATDLDLTPTFTNGGVANPASATPLPMRAPGSWDYIDIYGHAHELWCCYNGGWSSPDITGLLGAPQAETGSPLSGYTDSSGNINIFYINSSQHLELLAYTSSNGSWTATDLDLTPTFTNGGVANPASATPLPMRAPGSWDYIDIYGHVHELWCCYNGGWSSPDITGLLGAPQAETGSPLSGYTDSSGNINIFYINSSQHLELLAYTSLNGSWTATDLDLTPTFTNGGVANPASATPLPMRAPGSWDYIDIYGHVHELWCCYNGGWSSPDITGLLGAPQAETGSPLSGYTDSSRNIHLLYVNSSQHIEDLAYNNSNGAWTPTDLSVAAVTTYDSGTVSLTVSGFTVTVPYGCSGSNSACSGQSASTIAGQVAAALVQALNVTASPVTATLSGSTINLKWKTPGATASISGLTITSSQSNLFPNPSTFTDAYITRYSYDALGNLLRVDQKGFTPTDGTQWRTRLFTYDSLSRLLTAYNPESGTISYCYDANGNLLQKTSPAPNQTGSATQTISYCYDSLNRVTGKAYSAQTCPLTSPVVSYLYDQSSYQGLTITNGIGRLTGLVDQAGTGAYSYDALGRITNEKRAIAGITKSLSYSYNVDGSVATLTYPSGAVITYTPDSAGRMLSAVDTANNINYVKGTTYGPDNALTGFLSGQSASFAGITNSFSYNKRLQPVIMSASAPSQTVFSIGYDFHVGVGDNGNVFGITNYRDQTRNQTFTYDALNRLTSAQNAGTDCSKTTVNGPTAYWGNNYGYDPWGNLLQKTVTKCSAENLSVSALTNNQLVGYSYDAAGNMTYDATTGLNYNYDQENRITGAGGYVYTYDADGNRAEKSNGTTGTIYWYMSPGIIAESDLTGALKSEYVFFNGQRVARKDFSGTTTSVFYYFSDHLKTASVITDSAGNIKEDEDYYPWGGELQFVNNDSNHYKFSGKERDGETQLDYFGARYYGNWLGRWMSPDWTAKPSAVPYAELSDPQSLNLYSYVRNIPTARFDADGHSGCGWWCRFKQKVHNSWSYGEYVTNAELPGALEDERWWLINNVAKNLHQKATLQDLTPEQINKIYRQWDHAIMSAQEVPIYRAKDFTRDTVTGALILYRGGGFDNIEGHYKVDAQGNVRSGEGGRGPSLFDDPAKLPPRFVGDITKVNTDFLPRELIAKQIGKPGHFEIVPREPGMSPARFWELLKEIPKEPIE